MHTSSEWNACTHGQDVKALVEPATIKPFRYKGQRVTHANVMGVNGEALLQLSVVY